MEHPAGSWRVILGNYSNHPLTHPLTHSCVGYLLLMKKYLSQGHISTSVRERNCMRGASAKTLLKLMTNVHQIVCKLNYISSDCLFSQETLYG